jgi:hypothetical protein
MVLEVNGFPSFQGIHRATGRDMAPAVAERLVRLAKAARSARSGVRAVRRSAERRRARG